MKNKFLPLLFLSIFSTFLFCGDIVISLPTEQSDVTVYLCGCNGSNKELTMLANKILHADFLQDGRGVVFKRCDQSIACEQKKGDGFYQNPFWKKIRSDMQSSLQL